MNIRDPKRNRSRKPVWFEFECIECTAHNPWDDGFGLRDEVLCGFCGIQLVVKPGKSENAFRLEVR